MKNKGTGIQWHRIFGIAALMSVIVFAVMLYILWNFNKINGWYWK